MTVLRSRAWWLVAPVGVAVGAVVGYLALVVSGLHGLSLYLVCGTAIGLAAALAMRAFTGSVQLTEVQVSVPQFSQLTFAITPHDRLVAWRLFVESVTRVSIQPLEAGTGLIREAMNSLYLLFTHTREILAAAQPSRRTGDKPTTEHLAIAMLNIELRPFLSKWHPTLAAWEAEHGRSAESAWPAGAACRADLTAMQERLVGYANSFGQLAGLTQIDDLIWGRVGELPGSSSAPAARPTA